MSRQSSSKRKKKAKRAKLSIDLKLPRPAIVGASADGVEAQARDHALAAGHAVTGYVPLNQHLRPGELNTRTVFATQALKWNVHAAGATLILTANAVLFGRAKMAKEWCGRYRKPWLHLWPGCDEEARLEEWLRTHDVAVLHVTGPASWQAPALSNFVTATMQRVCPG